MSDFVTPRKRKAGGAAVPISGSSGRKRYVAVLDHNLHICVSQLIVAVRLHPTHPFYRSRHPLAPDTEAGLLCLILRPFTMLFLSLLSMIIADHQRAEHHERNCQRISRPS